MRHSKIRSAIDAETKAIESRPSYPPESVGYAIQIGAKREYLAFGHPVQNNCTRAQALKRVREVLRTTLPTFHNADFDLDVLEKDGIRYDGPYDDTMRLAFLNEPRSIDLGLKPQAEKWLGEPPSERDLLKEWILEHVPEARRSKSRWGEFICMAPGNLVGQYAKGDVSRTLRLQKLFAKRVHADGMDEAYRREMRVIPIKREMEAVGIRIRLAKLKREIGAYRRVKENLERAIRRRLGVKDMNVGSPKQLAKALIDNDLLSRIVRTEKGNISTKRVLLEQYCTDKKLVQMLAVQGTLDTYIGTFMERWIEVGEINDEYINPSFNTVRSTDEYGGGKSKGTRTGRFSSSDPNFQNIPSGVKDSPHFETLKILVQLLAKEGINFLGLREYFAPDEGHVFLRRDYSQQELRYLAHFEEGAFLKMYLENPKLDAHDAVQELVRQSMGVVFPRKHIKQTNFGIIYGMGVAKLAARLGLTENEASALKRAVMNAIPGVKAMLKADKKLARDGLPFYTWGGRKYFCEDPIYVDTADGGKEKIVLAYKMLNTRIQGSAADCTKEGMINVRDNMRHGRLVLQVHDELIASVPRQHAKKEMGYMREAMEDITMRLPMLTDGDIGRESWGTTVWTDSTKDGENRAAWRGL